MRARRVDGRGLRRHDWIPGLGNTEVMHGLPAGGTPPAPAALTLAIVDLKDDGPWTSPAALWGLTGEANRAQVEIWAPGGGGTVDSGGGGGAYARVDDLAVAAKTSYTVSGLSVAAAGKDAGDAVFADGSTELIKAEGGFADGSGGSASNCLGDVKFSGGAGATTANISGFSGTFFGGGGAGSAEDGDVPQPNWVGGNPDGGIGSSARSVMAGIGGSGGSVGLHPGGWGRVRLQYLVPATEGFPRLMRFRATRSLSNPTVVLPDHEPGDLLVLVASIQSTSQPSLTGWDVALTQNWVNTSWRLRVYSKIAVVAEPDVAVSVAARTSWTAFAFRNASAVVAAGAAFNGTTAAIDPPNLSTGVGTAKGLWMAYGENPGTFADGDVPISGPPTNYGNFFSNISAPTSSAQAWDIAFAFRELEASSENPGQFGQTLSGSNRWAVAATLCILPP